MSPPPLLVSRLPCSVSILAYCSTGSPERPNILWESEREQERERECVCTVMFYGNYSAPVSTTDQIYISQLTLAAQPQGLLGNMGVIERRGYGFVHIYVQTQTVA